MMNGILVLVLTAVAFLGGIRVLMAWKWWNGREEPLHRIWLDKKMYLASVIYGLAEVILFFWGNSRFSAGGAAVRCFDMLITYLLLTVIDIRKKMVPNEILLCYLAGQLLLAAAFTMPESWLGLWLGGIVLSLLLCLLVWFSKGGFGLGDVKLLGITALTAGWTYTLQIVCLALIPSFVYSLWALLVCHRERKMEIPFVPFLLIGMIMHFCWQCMG